MEFSSRTLIYFTLFTFLLHATHVFAAKKSYIVYMGSHSHGNNGVEEDFEKATAFHHEFLASFLGSHEKAKDAIFYSYNRHINGFAANLDEHQASEIEKHPDVVSVFLNQAKQLHTSHSWEFMMMERNGVVGSNSIWPHANYGEDVIIAHFDTGVWPESESFKDENYGPIPAKWNGSCKGSGISCNRKLIGAKYFIKGLLSTGAKVNSSAMTVRDFDGHGTHTLSTAGGNFVSDDLIGLGKGIVKGGSPRARVASYKVCWEAGCFDADMLAAFDQAIHDGVDVISASVGSWRWGYSTDPIAIGAFHASQKGIVVSASAGNEGPYTSSVTNGAPWIITVAASTTDRDFENHVELRDGQRLKGKSISRGLARRTLYHLITGAEAVASNANPSDSMLCQSGSLDPRKVKGKIVVCLRGVNGRLEKGYILSSLGAAGMILYNDKVSNEKLELDQHFLPATHISYKDGLSLLAYMNSTKYPLGYITTPKPVYNQKHSPNVAEFSSRGPSYVSPEILKPDITAPGVHIIAAWSEARAPSHLQFDNRKAKFAVASGTSMSAPHVAGVAGLLKTLHPDWSPAAIKSAIMTTARTRDNAMGRMIDARNCKKATPFMYGSGHIRPNSAMDPGLVYDLAPTDYIDYLCALGYNETTLKPFVRNSDYQCNDTKSIYDFNYPSIALPMLRVADDFTVTRTLKNVGSVSSYSAEIIVPKGVRMSVDPTVLIFEHPGQEISYKLKVTADFPTKGYVFGGVTWSDGKHYVRSPVAIKTQDKIPYN